MAKTRILKRGKKGFIQCPQCESISSNKLEQWKLNRPTNTIYICNECGCKFEVDRNESNF